MALDAARSLFPWWVAPVAFAAHAAAGVLVGVGLGAIFFVAVRGTLAGGDRSAWPLVAREIYPHRVTAILASVVLPAVVLLLVPFGPDTLLGMEWRVAGCSAAGAFVGVSFWRFRITRLLYGPGHTPARSLRGVATRALLLFPHLWIALGFALAMPPRLDATTAMVLAAATLVLVLVARGGTFRLAVAAGLVRDAPEDLAAAVREAAARTGVPLAGVHVIDLSQVNAFALPFLGRMLFTSHALERLDRTHLLAVADHELGHLGEPARARWSRAAGMLVLVPLMAVAPLGAAYGLAGPLAAVVAAFLIGQVVQRRVRALEHRADAAARESEADVGAYARALEEIYRVNLMPVVLRVPSHPNLYDRLAAAGAPPAYPRPRPPSRGVSFALLALIAFAAIVLVLAFDVGAFFMAGTGRPWAAVALDGGDHAVASQLASADHARGRPLEAAIFYGAAAELDPLHPGWPVYRALALAEAGRADEAREALAEAERRAAASRRPADWEPLLGSARAALGALPPTGPPPGARR